jgi:hypothetical protein
LLILIILAISLLGHLCYCHYSEFNFSPQKKNEFSINNYTFNAVWKNYVELTGVNNSTAILDQIFIKTADDETIESFKLSFYGQNGTQTQWYRIESIYGENPTRTVLNTNEIPNGVHPLVIMEEIKQIPYNQLACEDAGMDIYVNSQSGDLGYDSVYGELFLIREGKLTPLKKIVFHTEEPFYEIYICCNVKSSIVHYQPVNNEGNICCSIFTENDIEKAEILEYENYNL